MTVRVALAGHGAWGKNILRVLTENAAAALVAVVETDAPRLAAALERAPRAQGFRTLTEAAARGLDAAVIATPPHTHEALAAEALELGLDVLVEKPLATDLDAAERLSAGAQARGRVAMVGHLLRYHPVAIRLLELCREGALGALQRFESARLSIDGNRSASAAWTLGPHDFSILQAIDPSPIRALRARAAPSGDPSLIRLDLASGLEAHIALSRVGSTKERLIRVVGSEATAIFDDVRFPDRVRLVSRQGTPERTTDLPVAFREPLALEIEHFLECVETRATPRTSFEDGVRVVRALAQAEHEIFATPFESTNLGGFGGLPLGNPPS